ncbi:DUF3626 domain-containing protein [Micromonospora sp. 067-2]|uniref:DUF3626 domain-containing protein n=1 Tax=Micromonospora sp. 067-2 TaxID=2789270 RepID=UPI00397C347A
MTVQAEPSGPLSPAQAAAVAHVRSVALAERPAALACIASMVAVAEHPPQRLLLAIARRGRLTLNFHPDRPCADGRTVAAALAEDGVYRSQFVTGISNGLLMPSAGSDRDRWEWRMFGGAYQRVGVLPADRPVYGGLNLLDHPDGACPRFGSCHFRLRPAVLARATFCLGDSHLGPRMVGTIDGFEAVLAGLLTGTVATGVCLGRAGTDVATLARTLLSSVPDAPATSSAMGRALDDYVEAQVHGTLDLARDVEALVVDPSFIGTPVGETLEHIAHHYGCRLVRHRGFALPPDRVDPEFRGPAIPELAARVHAEFARPGELVAAALIGRAAASVVTDPDRWADRGPTSVTLQHLKQLWHVLVRYGAPHTS